MRSDLTEACAGLDGLVLGAGDDRLGASPPVRRALRRPSGPIVVSGARVALGEPFHRARQAFVDIHRRLVTDRALREQHVCVREPHVSRAGVREDRIGLGVRELGDDRQEPVNRSRLTPTTNAVSYTHLTLPTIY